MRMRATLAAMLTLLLTSPGLFAQTPTPAASPEEAAVRAAAKEFVAALALEPTIDKAKAAFGGSAEDAAQLQTLQKAIHSVGKLAEAVKKKFPDDKRFGADSMTPEGMVKAVDTQRVTVAGDTAHLGGGGPPLTLKKVDGKWKVTGVFGEDAASRRMTLSMLDSMITIVAQTLPEIQADKYASADDLDKVLTDRMQKSMQEKNALPPTRPSTPPPAKE